MDADGAVILQEPESWCVPRNVLLTFNLFWHAKISRRHGRNEEERAAAAADGAARAIAPGVAA